MRTSALAFLAALLTAASPALAQDDEEFLLGDYGVRVDLPDDWKPVEWADWAFEAETDDQRLHLWVWGDPVQQPVEAADLAAWATVYAAKAADTKGSDPQVQATEIATIGGRDVARVDVEADYGDGREGALVGATFPVAGKMVHWAVFTAASRKAEAVEALEMLLGRAEVRKEPLDTVNTVNAAGVTVTLPDGWRAPVAGEHKAVAARAAQLGVDDLNGCWTALRPVAASEPEVMVTCQAGLLLGVVDRLSFADVDEVLRTRLFGGVDVPPAQLVTNEDGRVGFLYRPELETRTLRMGVVPYGEGVARTWIIGPEGEGEVFDAVLTEVMRTARYEGDHPVGLGEQVSYYVAYRPTSLPVLGSVGVLVLLVGGAIFLATRGGRDRYAEFADDDL